MLSAEERCQLWWCHYCQQAFAPFYELRDGQRYKVYPSNCSQCGHAICDRCGVVSDLWPRWTQEEIDQAMRLGREDYEFFHGAGADSSCRPID